jgi:hypothetical protein
MIWQTVWTLKRGRVDPPEQLGVEDELQATESLHVAEDLGARAWTQRWDVLNETLEEKFA